MSELTQKRLKEILNYDPETGIFIWIKALSNRKQIGDIAGCVNGKGYIVIGINRKDYRSHRLAWLYMTGEWPKDEVDHKNHDKSDNRWQNLRAATHLENGRNQKMCTNNTSGVTGVYWFERIKKWRAYIYVDRKNKYLGFFDDFFEAICVRKSAELKYGFHENHGR